MLIGCGVLITPWTKFLITVLERGFGARENNETVMGTFQSLWNSLWKFFFFSPQKSFFIFWSAYIPRFSPVPTFQTATKAWCAVLQSNVSIPAEVIIQCLVIAFISIKLWQLLGNYTALTTSVRQQSFVTRVHVSTRQVARYNWPPMVKEIISFFYSPSLWDRNCPLLLNQQDILWDTAFSWLKSC